MPARTAALRDHQLSFAATYGGQPCAYCDLIHDWPDGFAVSRDGRPVCRGCARERLPAGYAHLAIALDGVDQALAAADRPLRRPMLRLLHSAVDVLEAAYGADTPARPA